MLALMMFGVCMLALASCERSGAQAPVARNSTSHTESQHPIAHALHNVHALNESIISGSAPEGDAAFDELWSIGIRTIISVDGATPDVAAAEARGMRYVHMPIIYAEVTAAEQAEIARAIRDLPGPVYLHCHHGKHRSPAAAAAVGVALGVITPDYGVAFMKTAGTAANYEGLFECVARATPLDAALIDAAPSNFPAVRTTRGMTAAMVQVDLAFEHIGAIRAAGWIVPATHPDLVPAVEAGRLADGLRIGGEDPRARAHGKDFIARLNIAAALAAILEEAIVRGASIDDLESAHAALAASCSDCHRVHRDRPR
jgi:protein tyrosine phosphatase (PTP) superfamily phosphohydrolase (DUF442 family)